MPPSMTADLASILRRSLIGCRSILSPGSSAPPPPPSVDRPRSLSASPKAHNCIISGRDHIKQRRANHRRTPGTAHFLPARLQLGPTKAQWQRTTDDWTTDDGRRDVGRQGCCADGGRLHGSDDAESLGCTSRGKARTLMRRGCTA